MKLRKKVLTGLCAATIAAMMVFTAGCGSADSKPSSLPTSSASSTSSASTSSSVASSETEAKQQQPKEPHIYDDAKSVDEMNGANTKAIGRVSVIMTTSDKVTKEALEDWYFNYVTQRPEFTYCVLVYTDTQDKGVYGARGSVNKDTDLEKNQDGTYSTSNNGKLYGPTNDGHLKEIKLDQ